MSNPRLTILSEVLRGQTYELSKDTYTIGRSDDKDIAIVDPTVSGLHAILTRNDDGTYTVKDNGSTNGTRINGVMIKEQRIVSSDILQVGGVEIMFDHEDGTPNATSHTRTTIHIDDSNQTQIGPIKPINTVTPNKGDNPRTALILRIAIGLLIIIVLVLGALLIYRLFG